MFYPISELGVTPGPAEAIKIDMGPLLRPPHESANTKNDYRSFFPVSGSSSSSQHCSGVQVDSARQCRGKECSRKFPAECKQSNSRHSPDAPLRETSPSCSEGCAQVVQSGGSIPMRSPDAPLRETSPSYSEGCAAEPENDARNSSSTNSTPHVREISQ